MLAGERSRLEALLNSPSLGPMALATALLVAFFLGAAHALTPGHGKAIVAAYLAGSRGRVLDAVYLGSIVTAAHTASVFALGLAALYASQHIAMDRIYPWLSLLSGFLVTTIGGWLLWQRTRKMRSHAHEHGHPHAHPHDQAHEHAHKGSLFSLGISGGLVPCPEALVVLMISISLGRLLLGLAVLVAFSIGLAAVLIAIGIAMVLAVPALRSMAGDKRWMRSLPVASAAVVTVLGIVIMAQAARTF